MAYFSEAGAKARQGKKGRVEKTFGELTPNMVVRVTGFFAIDRHETDFEVEVTGEKEGKKVKERFNRTQYMNFIFEPPEAAIFSDANPAQNPPTPEAAMFPNLARLKR